MLLTTKEAAATLKISERTLRTSRYTGVLLGRTPPVYLKIGNAIRYRDDDLTRWIDENTREVFPHVV